MSLHSWPVATRQCLRAMVCIMTLWGFIVLLTDVSCNPQKLHFWRSVHMSILMLNITSCTVVWSMCASYLLVTLECLRCVTRSFSLCTVIILRNRWKVKLRPDNCWFVMLSYVLIWGRTRLCSSDAVNWVNESGHRPYPLSNLICNQRNCNITLTGHFAGSLWADMLV